LGVALIDNVGLILLECQFITLLAESCPSSGAKEKDEDTSTDWTNKSAAVDTVPNEPRLEDRGQLVVMHLRLFDQVLVYSSCRKPDT
jgi:hypothetical protein